MFFYKIQHVRLTHAKTQEFVRLVALHLNASAPMDSRETSAKTGLQIVKDFKIESRKLNESISYLEK